MNWALRLVLPRSQIFFSPYPKEQRGEREKIHFSYPLSPNPWNLIYIYIYLSILQPHPPCPTQDLPPSSYRNMQISQEERLMISVVENSLFVESMIWLLRTTEWTPKMKGKVTSGGFARRISISQEQLANSICDPWVDPSKRDEKVLCLHPAQGQSRSSPGREVPVAIGNGLE